jgi:hypothetical protein
MTTKQKFEVDDPCVVVLRNGRYAYRVKCPWEGKAGKELYAFKFCSAAAYKAWEEKQALAAEEMQADRPEEKQALENLPESPESEPEM